MENKKPDSGLLSHNVLKNLEFVRAEFVSPVFLPKITLAHDNFIFNTACVRLFPETEYVQIIVNPAKNQLKVLPSKPSDKSAVKWSNSKNNKHQPQNIQSRSFCSQIFLMMDWNVKYRYKVMAIFQELGGQKFLIFNLNDFEMNK